ncbi:MAG: lipocalin family protein [Bacteroidota bacterium]|nr:lipocalin family protein [Bacteroidota bacterium]MDP4214822.1 lipocalin family protein [Bacteroidota bacterium]MDP4247234.1 lipocalin family protein [Bacteroidota bacterium]MDP4253124.1 lipocalin family protein [Bacteroidota bacterium]MDP4259020.1 lipocalin family protein [Bacteroidota bacterium]
MQKKALIVSLLISLVLSLAFVACSKSSSSTGGNTNADSVNISKAAWKLSTSGFNLSGGATVTIVDTSVKPCQKDNTYSFNANGSGTMDEGATKCNVSDPQTQPFTWSFSARDTVLHIHSNTILNGDLNIYTLSATSFVVFKDTSFLSQPIRYVVIMQH